MAEPAFTFGVIADVQWADLEDGYNYSRTVRRCYRGALDVLRNACQLWAQHDLAFIAQLGDLIDGKNSARGSAVPAMEAATGLLNRLVCPTYHVIGNHELYCFTRSELSTHLGHAPVGVGSTPGGLRYFSTTPAPGFRVVVLDTFAESIILPEGGSADDRHKTANTEQFRRAMQGLQAVNPNDVTQNGDWLRGLSGAERCFVPYNGALGGEQLAWLRSELAAAASARERVVILSHAILYPEACDGTTMAWDHSEALEAIARSGIVVAVVCGHDHVGYYARDPATRVHHLTLASPLNKGADGHAYGEVAVYADRIEVRGPVLSDLLPPDTSSTLPPARLGKDGLEAVELLF
jgi:manganese-dependent ADP-ribose/CDP-alcohol diphosphatase